MHLNFLYWTRSKRGDAEIAEDFAEKNEGHVMGLGMILLLISSTISGLFTVNLATPSFAKAPADKLRFAEFFLMLRP